MLASLIVSLTSMCGMSAYVLWYTRPPDLLMIQSECTPGGTPASCASTARLRHSRSSGSMSWDMVRGGGVRGDAAPASGPDPTALLDVASPKLRLVVSALFAKRLALSVNGILFLNSNRAAVHVFHRLKRDRAGPTRFPVRFEPKLRFLRSNRDQSSV